MKENVILVNYNVESEAYQALSELKRAAANANYTISQAAVVKKENGVLTTMDGFVNGSASGDDAWKGTLIGSLVGVLGGPLGILLGGSVGMLIGGAVDANEMADSASLLEKAGDGQPRYAAPFLHSRRQDRDPPAGPGGIRDRADREAQRF